jgi:serine/threonine protein kinase
LLLAQYGKVYRGLWRNMAVAVKSMVLPIKMGGAESRERMAIMEAAISSSLSHPNIVKTYTYSLKPVRGSGNGESASQSRKSPVHHFFQSADSRVSLNNEPATAAGIKNSRGGVSAFEVQIVQELCDCGSLREALDKGFYHDPLYGKVNYPAVLDTAADIACGMRHLHACNILHSDLKVRIDIHCISSHGLSIGLASGWS